ncbi:MAG: hypothetical protein FRX49_07993 [Trebouxia sp. A1-2]|nr:MAG: hypothetical protein FRX49_07993 [Trebouxia sp. A1-2]
MCRNNLQRELTTSVNTLAAAAKQAGYSTFNKWREESPDDYDKLEQQTADKLFLSLGHEWPLKGLLTSVRIKAYLSSNAPAKM